MKATKWMAAIVPLAAAAAFLLGSAHPAYSFLPGFASIGKPTRWSMTAFPVQYNINISTGSNISGSNPAPAVIQAAFATWMLAPNTSLTVSRGNDSTLTSVPPSPSPINLICFVCTDSSFSDPKTLAVTIFTFATSTGQSDGRGGTSQFVGQMLNASTLFNPNASFTTNPSAASNTVTDLQTVATHELGHFLGIDHSAVINSIMFPFSPNVRESLAYDDVAGISSLYPGNFSVGTGTLQGQVVFQSSGAGVFGAHVFADSTTSNQGYGSSVRKGPISTLTDTGGNYSITGLPADTYTVTAEPLDGPVTNTDVSDYPTIFGRSSVDTNFTTRQH